MAGDRQPDSGSLDTHPPVNDMARRPTAARRCRPGGFRLQRQRLSTSEAHAPFVAPAFQLPPGGIAC
jgi:hypothetical protein